MNARKPSGLRAAQTKVASEDSSRLPVLLQRAVSDRNLVLVVGAGASMLAPSSLPDWRQFNEILLSEIKSEALTVGTLDDPARSAISELGLEDVGVASFSEALVKSVAGEFYFPALKVLDSDQANSNHLAIADLAKRGMLRGIVTTNFDTLIERAFASEAIALRVAIDEQDFLLTPDAASPCTLYKVHGSVTDATTLIDTVGQKLRGLPEYVRACLARLFADHHVLVVGYSGADLEFGGDYLPFADSAPTTPGLTWVVRPGTNPAPRVAEVMCRGGQAASLIEANLPELLHRLGARAMENSATPDADSRRLAAERTRPHLAKLIAAFGARNSLAFCLRLTTDAGRTDASARLHAALAAAIRMPREPDSQSNDGPAIRALAITSRLLGDAPAAETWTRLEIDRLEKQMQAWEITSRQVAESLAHGAGRDLAKQPLPYPFRGHFTPEGWRELDCRIRDENWRLLAGAWTNLALDCVRHADLVGVGKALERSLDSCEFCADSVALAAMFGAYAEWQRLIGVDPDDVLAWASMAEIAGLVAGNVDAANFAAIFRADISLWLGEYDAALAALNRVRQRQSLGLSLEMLVETVRLAGVIQVRRGDPRGALETWRHALPKLVASRALSARVHWTIVTHLAHNPLFHDDLASECEALIEILHSPGLARVEGVPSLQEVERIRRNLAASNGGPPAFLRPWPEATDNPAVRKSSEIWLALRYAEAGGDQVAVLSALRQLGWHLYTTGKTPRALEVARVLRAVAERDGNRMELSGAEWLLGNVLFALGDNEGARESFTGLIAADESGDSEIRKRVAARLAEVDRDPQPRNLVLDFIPILEGNGPGPRGAEEAEALAGRALAAREYGPMRVMAFKAISLRRQRSDRSGMARGYEMLAEAAAVEGRNAQAARLRAKALSYRSP